MKGKEIGGGIGSIAGAGLRGSVSGGVGIGSSLGGLGRGFSEGASIGKAAAISTAPAGNFSSSLGLLGAKLEAPFQSFVKEGPVKKGGLENTMPIYTLNATNAISPRGEIAFKPSKTSIEVNQAVQLPSIGRINTADPLSGLINTTNLILAKGKPKSVDKPPVLPRANITTGQDPTLIEEDIVTEAEHWLGLDRPKKVSRPVVEAKIELKPIPSTQPDLSKIQAVREKISWLGKIQPATRVKPLAAPQIQPDFLTPFFSQSKTVPRFIPAPALEPTLKAEAVLAAHTSTDPQTESKASPRIVQAVSAPVTQEQVEERIEAEENVQIQGKEERTTHQEEKFERVKALHVVDKVQVTKRIVHIVKAFVEVLQTKKAASEKGVEVKIKGKEATLLLLPSNKSEIRGGEINNKDPEETLSDKTWDATVKQLEGQEFSSKEEIEQRVPKIVHINHPVILAENGEQASPENVIKSHNHTESSNHGVIEFERRMKLKRDQVKVVKNDQPSVQVAVQEETQKKIEVAEGIIHDHFPLAQALKAA